MSNPEFLAPNFTTQAAATYKANIDASIAANGADYINLGCTYTVGTGVFTIHGAEGTALASTNPAFVKFQDIATPGQVKYISVEANQSFIDDNGASEIINNLFGLTTGRAWAEDMPFYIYAVANDAMTSVQFMLSRIPHATVAPPAANIGAPDDAVADAETDFWSFDNIDETTYNGNPCVCVGSITMQMTASDDWTVQTLTTKHGIGQFQESIAFTYPVGHNGNDAADYFISGAGTAPVFSTNSYSYMVSKNGFCTLSGAFHSDGGTDGSGAVPVNMGMPFSAKDASTIADNVVVSQGRTFGAGGAITTGTITHYTASTVDPDTFFMYIGNTDSVEYQDFGNGNRYITFAGSYKIDLTY